MNKNVWSVLGLSAAAVSFTMSGSALAEPPTSRRIVGQTLSSTQAVLLDEDAGEYRIVRIGDEVNGGRVVAIGADEVVLVHGGTQELLTLAADPRPRPKRVLEPMVINIKPMSIGAPVAAAPVAPVAVAPAPVAIAPAAPAPQTITLSAPPAPPVAAAEPAPAVAIAETPPTTTTITANAQDSGQQQLPPGAPKIVFVQPLIPPPAEPAAPVATPAPIAAPMSSSASMSVSSITVPRAELDRGLNDFATLDASVNLDIAPQGGFHVAELRPGSFLEKMGLRRGDVIQRVDGRWLRSAEDAQAAYNWVRVTDHFSVDLIRDGRPVTLRFQISA